MHYSLHLSLCILSSLFFIQCSHNSTSEKTENQELDRLTVYPADSEPIYDVNLLQEQTFGVVKDPGEPYLIVITDCEVDESNRVIVRGQDNDFKTGLHVYNPDGTYRKQIGRIGSGPGEYEFVSPNFQINNGRLFLYDGTNARLSIFEADDYSFEGTTVLQDWDVRDLEAVRNMQLSDFHARSDGNLLAIFKAFPNGSGFAANTKFMLVDTEGNSLSTEPLIELPSPFYLIFDNQGDSMFPISARIPLPFLGSSHFVLSNDDKIFTARTDDFLIKKYDREGAYQYAFYYPVTGPPFDIKSFIKSNTYLTQSVFKNELVNADIEIPESFSVIGDIRVDDKHRIWVSVMVESYQTYEWWILGESGVLLAKIFLPENNSICDIQDGYLYTRSFDSKGSNDPESWESKVVKYRINLTER